MTATVPDWPPGATGTEDFLRTRVAFGHAKLQVRRLFQPNPAYRPAHRRPSSRMASNALGPAGSWRVLTKNEAAMASMDKRPDGRYRARWRSIPAGLGRPASSPARATPARLPRRPIGSVRRSEIQAWVKALSGVLTPAAVELVYRWVPGIFESRRRRPADRLVAVHPHRPAQGQHAEAEALAAAVPDRGIRVTGVGDLPRRPALLLLPAHRQGLLGQDRPAPPPATSL